jgi:hypothetical protein
MDNQQATSRIAGLYLGEGHFSLAKTPRSTGKWNIKTEIGFSNTDPALVDLVCEFLDVNDVKHHIGMNNSTCYQVRVTRHEEIKKLLDILLPYLYGRKSAEAKLLYRFTTRALAKLSAPVESGSGGGQFAGFERRRKNMAFDAEDIAMADEKESLRESSETTRIPQCWEKHKYGDLTRVVHIPSVVKI